MGNYLNFGYLFSWKYVISPVRHKHSAYPCFMHMPVLSLGCIYQTVTMTIEASFLIHEWPILLSFICILFRFPNNNNCRWSNVYHDVNEEYHVGYMHTSVLLSQCRINVEQGPTMSTTWHINVILYTGGYTVWFFFQF